MTKCQKICRIDSLKLLLLFASFNLIISQRSTIRNPCMHNQFRCTDNGPCLRTEFLCNGVKNCPNGEDERGGRGWNCGKTSLAKDYCDPLSQFRCRFGGCISRISLCNGRADCWGGGDEALDVCTGDKTVIPQVSPGSSAPNFPVQRPNPAPQPIQPAPIRTTQRPRPIQTTANSFPNRGGFGSCGDIVEDSTRGFKVTCLNSRSFEVSCADVPEGGTAQYTCRKYFTATSQLVRTARRTCQNGRWTPVNNKFACEADCGISSSEIGAFIVGGSVAKAGRWPWMVAIYEKNSRNPNGMELICGASLISSKAVITAAHCVVNRDSGGIKRLSDLKIVMGKYYRQFDRRSGGEQERGIAQVFKHPDYSSVTLYNDIAIIKLSEPVQISETVRPVCLAGSGDYIEQNVLGTLIGWGRGDGKSFQEQLQQANLPMIQSQQCIGSHPQFGRLVHKGTFCAGYTNGTSACDGDSGGPLVFRDRYRPGRWVLYGIVSAGIASPDGRAGCNPNHYTVFTDVGYHLIRTWIDDTIDSNFKV